MAKVHDLTNKDYVSAVRKSVTIQVRVKTTVVWWWSLRLSLAVALARLAAWVGGTSLEIGDYK